MFLVASVVDSRPVKKIENKKEKGEEDKEGQVGDCVAVFLPPATIELTQLHLEQDSRVLHQGGEHEDNAGDHPGLHGGESLSLQIRQATHKVMGAQHYLGGVGLDCIEDVDEHEKDGNEKSHSSRNNLKWKNVSSI